MENQKRKNMRGEKPLKAIPTEYNGIQMKSRLETQCAFLLDQLEWNWQYERASYMLPNGIPFIPDFWLEDLGLFIECRGYDNKKGRRQIAGLAALVAPGFLVDEKEGIEASRFLIIYGDAPPQYYVRKSRCGMCLLLHCPECGWRPAPAHTEGAPLAYCESCTTPIDPSRKGLGIDRAAIVTAVEGKLLINGVGIEDWNPGV